MEEGLAAHVVAIAAFGTASGLEIVGKRRGEILLSPAGSVATLSGLADIFMMAVALFRFGLGSGLGAIAIGVVATGILSAVLPGILRPGFIYLFALIGVGATAVSFF